MNSPSVPVSLATMTWGNSGGPRVLLVHGLSGAGGTWWRIASELSTLGMHVTAVDLRGHGNSPSTLTYQFADHAADLAALGGSWDLVIGHSLAGPIVATFVHDTHAATKVLLLDPVFDIADSDFEAVVADQLGEVDPLATAHDIAATNPTWHSHDCFHKALGARMTSHFVVEQCLRDNAPYHHLRTLAELNITVKILGADPALGTMSPQASFDALGKANIEHSQVHGAGHGVQRDQPEVVVNEAIKLVHS